MNNASVTLDDLPVGRAPEPIATPYFPDALHAVVWRNWDFVDVNHLARLLRGTAEQIAEVARSMGLPSQRHITPQDQTRNYFSILRRNWHLLPYEQLCELLAWDAAEMLYSLNEDDFMWIKLGSYKPNCRPVHYAPPGESVRRQAARIAEILREELGDAMQAPCEAPYGFIDRFSAKPSERVPGNSRFETRMCYPYFLRFGDPLVGDGIDDIPDGYLAQLQSCGVNAIWIQALLNKLYPWDLAPELSAGWQERISNLQKLVARCRKYGIDVMLYLNEPRAMPPAFFGKYPELRGIGETPDRVGYAPDVVSLCTSVPAVQEFLVNSIRHVFEQVPDLGGVFTITYSENLTNCWSRSYEPHDACPRCLKRGPQTIHAEFHDLIDRGMTLAGSNAKLFWYVWSCPEQWIAGIIEKLPRRVQVLCISEWGKTFTRGDYTGKCNEYSISVIGPSDQSVRQWALAQQRGLKTVAKLQAGTSFEMFLIPFLPATARVAQHVSNLCDASVDSLMLGWTLGGYPSTNLEMAAEMGRQPQPSVRDAMMAVAQRRFGAAAAESVVPAWEALSSAYGEFPMDIATVYTGPQSMGPANLLHATPTGLNATMITFPYDHLDAWRGPYSPQTFQRQFEKLADQWQQGVELLDAARKAHPSDALEDEWRIADACGICFRSAANQVRFVRIRQTDRTQAAAIARDEIKLARRMFDQVCADSRIGFEATMQYAFSRFDLAEKVLNCRWILTHAEE